MNTEPCAKCGDPTRWQYRLMCDANAEIVAVRWNIPAYISFNQFFSVRGVTSIANIGVPSGQADFLVPKKVRP